MIDIDFNVTANIVDKNDTCGDKMRVESGIA